MRAELMLLFGYLMMTGVSAGFCALFSVVSGEGMVLSCVLLSVVMYIGAAAGQIRAAAVIFCALGLVGFLLLLKKTAVFRKAGGRMAADRAVPASGPAGAGEGKSACGSFFTLSLCLLAVMTVLQSILFHNDFIQKIDDFHQWAAAVKYMLEEGRLPDPYDFIGDAGLPMFTSAFHLFFQVLGGYHEGNMYTSSFLLTAAALLLPAAHIPWARWKRGLCYVVMVYLGMFSLYLHAFKSIYVDLPAAAWASALCLWWSRSLREERSEGAVPGTQSGPAAGAGPAPQGALAGGPGPASQGVQGGGAGPALQSVPAAGAAPGTQGVRSAGRARLRVRRLLMIAAMGFMVCVSKWAIGFLLFGFSLLYLLCDGLIAMGRERVRSWIRGHRKQTAAAAVLLVLLAAAAVLVGIHMVGGSGSGAAAASADAASSGAGTLSGMSGLKEALTVSSDKARLTLRALAKNIYTTYLSGHSRLRVRALQAVLLMAIAFLALSAAEGKKYAALLRFQCGFSAGTFVLYLAALYISYVMTFSYEESVGNAAVHRYLSIIVLYIYFLLCGMLAFAEGENLREKPARTMAAVRLSVCVLFAAGLSGHFLRDISSYENEKTGELQGITEAKTRLAALEEIVPDDARVYLLDQALSAEDMNEFPLCTILYYRGMKSSSYLREPWKFDSEGSFRLLSRDQWKIGRFPDILRWGYYSYLWVYETDDFLNEALPEVISCDSPMKRGLWQCVWTDGKVTALEYLGDY